LTFCFAFSTPIASITSSVSLSPAVSINRNKIPSIVSVSSIVSLVVPGIFETIALSSLKSAFNNDDFPVFGLPAIATGTPFFITFP
tara:strand:- start:147 stop:404 length:258 start_codon:yes stop_codon:yes gene_type:complete